MIMRDIIQDKNQTMMVICSRSFEVVKRTIRHYDNIIEVVFIHRMSNIDMIMCESNQEVPS